MDGAVTINEISSIGELAFYLSGLTQRTWTTSELTREIIRLRLPVYGPAPLGAAIESRRRDDNGVLVVTAQPAMSASYVTLLQHEIEELAQSVGPRIITDRPAWQRGEAPFQPWDSIAAFRTANHRVLNHWEVEHGEWMGQSDEYFFSELLQITGDSNLYIPSFAIAELLKADSKRQQVSQARAQEGVSNGGGQPDGVGPEVRQEPLFAPTRGQQQKNNWDNHGLRRLLEESRMADGTQIALAQKYGVSRQRIATLLDKANKLFERQKASPFDALDKRRKK